MKRLCFNCDKRKVGCHATCQPYIVDKVINTYKLNKRFVEREIDYNPVREIQLERKIRKSMCW